MPASLISNRAILTMSKKILLYNCINKQFFGKISDPISLGVLALSSTLKQAGYQTKLIPNIENKDTINILRQELKNTLMVGVSCMTGDPILNGIKFSQAVKKINPKAAICWGGYHATMDYQNTIKENFVDYIIRGQGESAIVELANTINRHQKLSSIKGLVYKHNQKVIVNPIRPVEAINKFPFFDYNAYLSCYKLKKLDEIIYCSSRGCPFECTFCSVSNFYNKKSFSYSNKRFLQDIKTIVNRYNPTIIRIWDDNFFVNKKRVIIFLKNYLKNNYRFKWEAFARCSSFNQENKNYLTLLKKTNCSRILFGAESGSNKILRYIKKHIQTQDIIKSCKIISKYNINMDYTFMSGFPGETIIDFKKTIAIIKKLNKINPQISSRLFSFNLSPGIPILKDCQKHGFKHPKKLKGWSLFEYHSFIAPWISQEHQRLLKILVWITTFLSSTNAPSSSNFFINSIMKLLTVDARFRFQNNFYSFAPEWRLFYWLYKKHYTQA